MTRTTAGHPERTAWLLACLAAAALTAGTHGASRQGPPQNPPPQQPPSFRTATIVVPIDVRVLDRDGKPVTGLKQEDFILTENGASQTIGHFEAHVLKAETPSDERLRVRESAFGIPDQTRRIFLLVLGRGRLQEPSKALDALQRFLREQLLPQDLVAAFAYDRATDFTTDHEAVARFVDRFKRDHYQIDMEVGLAIESSMAAIYGSRALPKGTQAKIDAMFQGAGTLGYTNLGKGETAGSRQIEATAKAQAAAKQMQSTADTSKALMADVPGADNLRWTELEAVGAQEFTNLGLDEFMANTAQSLQDLGNLYAGVEYLRHFDGEKHLVFVTERGLNLPRAEADLDLTRAANDARVSIDTFQVGGLLGQQGGTWTDQSAQTFAFQTLRRLAEETGGVSSVSEPGMVAVSRINASTTADYLLGYYPSMASMTGGYRAIEVKVKRPDVTVLYRHGYYAQREVSAFNRRNFITSDRLQAAAAFRREIKDIKVSLDASLQKSERGHQLAVKASIDAAKLGLVTIDGVRTGQLDILVMCFDEKGNVVGQNYQRADVKLTAEMYQKVSKGGLPYGVRFDVNPGVRLVRLVVYDYKSDLVGSVDTKVF